MSEGSRILFSTDGHVARLTINRPERMNAFDPDTHVELSAATCYAAFTPTIEARLLAAHPVPPPSHESELLAQDVGSDLVSRLRVLADDVERLTGSGRTKMKDQAPV